MTFLNTVANLGSLIYASPVLKVMDLSTTKVCISQNSQRELGMCGSKEESQMCVSAKGKCIEGQDGYYLWCAVCTAIGVVWMIVMFSKVKALESLPEKAWVCADKSAVDKVRCLFTSFIFV